jgi:hypothetical protein
MEIPARGLPASSANREMVWRVAERLGPRLRSRVVFLGGATVAFLTTEPAPPEIRPTRDVDVIVQVLSYAQYAQFQTDLRRRGFRDDDTDGAPICRWRMEDLIVDVMPTAPDVLGFTNRWYGGAFQNATIYPLDRALGVTSTATADRRKNATGMRIRLVTAPYFVATKLEAFEDRGKDNLYGSPDLEDVITVVSGRPELASEVDAMKGSDVAAFLADACRNLLARPGFRDAVEGHLPPREAADRRDVVLQRMLKISEL